MDGAKGSALEWALALLRAPGERHALRQKPLPAGMDRLLGIAAGAMPEALAEAARTFGEPEARVREAAQFYAREVLFFPQADAYRTLGVAADASAEQVKTHHRLLQHWLHPDRLQSEDDAVFAARVNSAWNCLRSQERRQAYDEAVQQNRPPEVFDSNDSLRSVHAWVPDSEVPRDRWRHRLPMLALSAACLVLVLFVVRDMGRRPEAWDLPDRRESASAGAEEEMGISVPRQAEPDAVARRPRKTREGLRPATAVVAPRQAMPVRIAPVESLAAAYSAPAGPPASAMPSSAMTVPSSPVIEAPRTAQAQASVSEQPPPKPVARPEAGPSAPSFARIQSARQAGDQLLRYMGAVNQSPPPIWNSPGIQSSAERLRLDLHGVGRIKLAEPQWRIGEETAMVSSSYQLLGDPSRSGRLTADLVWRENHWLVTGVSMERAR